MLECSGSLDPFLGEVRKHRSGTHGRNKGIRKHRGIQYVSEL